jgi:hypothetical protein
LLKNIAGIPKEYGKPPDEFGASKDYDQAAIISLCNYLDNNIVGAVDFPQILTIYLPGNDHYSHLYGNMWMEEYLKSINFLIKLLIGYLKSINIFEDTIWIYVADHGEAEMLNEDEGSKEGKVDIIKDLYEFFQDIEDENKITLYSKFNDAWDEDERKEANAFAFNNGGGGGYIYLSNINYIVTENPEDWIYDPCVTTDLMPFLQGIIDATKEGGKLYGKLDDIIVKVGDEYKVYRRGAKFPHDCDPLSTLNPAYLDAVNRINNFACERSPDIILLPNYRGSDTWPPPGHYLSGSDTQTHYFDCQIEDATHGSLYPWDSSPALYIGSPKGGTGEERLDELLGQAGSANKKVKWSISTQPHVVDIAPTIAHILDFYKGIEDQFDGKSVFEPYTDSRGQDAKDSINNKLRPLDVNSDGVIDISDFVLVGSHFGETGGGIVGDVNRDGVVDISDLTLVGSHFGK